jgi:MFS family permease
MRPIGGLVIGRISDRLGREPAMILSFSLMGIAIAGLALTPTRSMIGMAAPILARVSPWAARWGLRAHCCWSQLRRNAGQLADEIAE